jgi:hypothetical protein
MTPRSERPRSREFVAARRAKQLERTQAHSATLLVALLASGCTRRPPNRTRARTNRTGHGLRWRRRRKGSGLFGWGAAPVAPKAPKRRTRLRWPRGSAASAPPRHSLSPSLGNGGAAFPLNCRSTVISTHHLAPLCNSSHRPRVAPARLHGPSPLCSALCSDFREPFPDCTTDCPRQ